jgi:hypothetical protein
MSSTLTIAEAETRLGVDVLDHLDRDALVPVCDGLQFQGDVAVIPAVMAGHTVRNATTKLPEGGFPVVRGEVGANTHSLIADPGAEVFFDPHTPTGGDLLLGVLTVASGVAYLAHPEHAFSGIARGTYELRRQREQADEVRLVAD